MVSMLNQITGSTVDNGDDYLELDDIQMLDINKSKTAKGRAHGRDEREVKSVFFC